MMFWLPVLITILTTYEATADFVNVTVHGTVFWKGNPLEWNPTYEEGGKWNVPLKTDICKHIEKTLSGTFVLGPALKHCQVVRIIKRPFSVAIRLSFDEDIFQKEKMNTKCTTFGVILKYLVLTHQDRKGVHSVGSVITVKG
ncbi:hypothetical protein EG68_03451 [Paragonimus skrjabini miyazakii]|uniref:Uncharacterized protein n=1 Tax=Paragonimus skrjabini miyazakii TaxID=59628 RepID=A0A8S9YWE8_9TREM|nr:hypothetical protein EG68_03451 [Paragonimus skrjabini miyazakii]